MDVTQFRKKIDYLASQYQIENYTKEDLKQEAYLALLEKLQKYKKKSNINTYAEVVIRNHFKDLAKKKRVETCNIDDYEVDNERNIYKKDLTN